MVDYFRAKLPGIRSGARACLLQTMDLAEHQGDQLTEEELFANANLMLIAGHETTTGLIGNGMLALLKDPDQLQKLQVSPGLLPNAIEELLRRDGPVQFTNRVAREDVTIGGKTIRKGELVFLFLAAANRDPAHFPDPARLDITRTDHKHVELGQGHHFCMGAPLARLEAQIAFSTLLRRLPNLRLEPGPLIYRDNLNLRSLVSLPLAFG
jgi:pimeloyl-[acyl-carrier protein] synthase